MPRFFFDIADRQDRVGAELPDRESARAYAIGLAETVLRREAEEADAPTSTVEIRDETGQVVDTVKSVQP